MYLYEDGNEPKYDSSKHSTNVRDHQRNTRDMPSPVSGVGHCSLWGTIKVGNVGIRSAHVSAHVDMFHLDRVSIDIDSETK